MPTFEEISTLAKTVPTFAQTSDPYIDFNKYAIDVGENPNVEGERDYLGWQVTLYPEDGGHYCRVVMNTADYGWYDTTGIPDEFASADVTESIRQSLIDGIIEIEQSTGIDTGLIPKVKAATTFDKEIS